MTHSFYATTAMALCLACTAAQAQGEAGLYSKTQITGHVVEPLKVDATDERIRALKVPDGFSVNVFARDLVNPRMLAVADDGTVYVTRREIGDVVMLRDKDGDGEAEERRVVANRPQMHGIAIDGRRMFLATVKDVYVADIAEDGSLGELERIIDDLPDGGQHPNRTLVMGPDGMLYISVGSTCNACAETSQESATLLRAKPDGTERTIFASGLRNTIGFGFGPQSGELWGMDHGIDWLGDEEQPEELNMISQGKQYGWPYVYAASKFNPQDNPPGGMSLEEWAKASTEPVLTYTAHAAPMQMAFYSGSAFPDEYRDDAFVAMRGSWNRSEPSGFEVARIRFEDEKPVAIEPFLTGFVSERNGRHEQFARLAGVATAGDGSLLVSDDSNGMIYRVSHKGGGERAASTSPNRSAAAETLPSKKPQPLAIDALAGGERGIKVTSPAFDAGMAIPSKFSHEGERISPPLAWEDAPAGAKSFAVVMEDPDVSENPPFIHWTAWNIPAGMTELPEGIPSTPKLSEPTGAVQGANTRGSVGYTGPHPPVGDDVHNYHVQIFALDSMLDLQPGAKREDLLKAMEGHVLGAGEIVGTFKRDRAGK